MSDLEDADQIYSPYQYEFRGFLFGSRTRIVVESVEGLLSMGTVEPSDIPNQADHGQFMGFDRITGKNITIVMHPLENAGADIESLIYEMQTAFQSTPDEYPLSFSRPGRIKKFVNARCRRRDIPTSYELAHGHGLVTVELAGTDPRIHSVAQYEEAAQILPGDTDVSIDVVMNGNFVYGAQPIIQIDGPANAPVISNDNDGNKQLKIGANIAGGETLEINVAERTVTIDGDNAYNPDTVLPGTRWWSLMPGLNQITFLRTGSSGTADVRVLWRDAFS